MRTLVLLVASLAVCSCQGLNAYNANVSAREDSLTASSKDGNYGGAYTHRVEYGNRKPVLAPK